MRAWVLEGPNVRMSDDTRSLVWFKNTHSTVDRSFRDAIIRGDTPCPVKGGLDESRPVVSVHGTPPVCALDLARLDGGRRADEAEEARERLRMGTLTRRFLAEIDWKKKTYREHMHRGAGPCADNRMRAWLRAEVA